MNLDRFVLYIYIYLYSYSTLSFVLLFWVRILTFSLTASFDLHKFEKGSAIDLENINFLNLVNRYRKKIFCRRDLWTNSSQVLIVQLENVNPQICYWTPFSLIQLPLGKHWIVGIATSLSCTYQSYVHL